MSKHQLTRDQYVEMIEGEEIFSSIHESYVAVVGGQVWSFGEVLEPTINKSMAQYLYDSMTEDMGYGPGASVEVYDAARKTSHYRKDRDA